LCVVIIPFRILAGPIDPIPPLEDLEVALRAGKLPRFQALWGKPPGGDCHGIATALIADINTAGLRGWVWCRARCTDVGDHSWLECGGWTFDASNGCRRGVIVMCSHIYRELRGVGPL
jgi:hypothetical protein